MRLCWFKSSLLHYKTLEDKELQTTLIIGVVFLFSYRYPMTSAKA